MAARMRCGSLGSSQNGCSTSLRIGGMTAVAGEIQPVGEPAFLGEEADEVLGERRISAGLEDHGAQDETVDDERLAVGAVRPVDGRGVLVVVAGRAVRSAPGIESVVFAVITTVWARNALLLPMLVQLTESGGVQPLRQIAV